MNLTWATSIFHFLSHKDWLKDEHVTQCESIPAYPGIFPGVSRRKEYSFNCTWINADIGLELPGVAKAA